jgi:hypothetical protein
MTSTQSPEEPGTGKVARRGAQQKDQRSSAQPGKSTQAAQGIARLLAVMEPGVKYLPAELAVKIGITHYAAQALLSRALNSGAIREAGKVRCNRFWVPTGEELAIEARRRELGRWGQGELTGYREEHRQFRSLCMLTRR